MMRQQFLVKLMIWPRGFSRDPGKKTRLKPRLPFALNLSSRAIPILLGLAVIACNPQTATPDLVATQVAVEKAAAATLTAEAVITQQAASTTPTLALTEPTPTLSLPTATPTGAASPPTPTNTLEAPAAPMCTVVAASVILRSGPGVAYEPPIANLGQGATLTPVGFSAVGYPGGQWVQVQTPDNLTGWVSTDPQFVACNVNPATLPPVSVPPPTATPTPIPAQPTPTPSPTPEQFVIFEPPGGGNDNIDGYLVFPGYTQDQLNINDLVFRDKLVFQVVAFDKNWGQSDGAGIDNVRFKISGDQGTVHERTEENAAYCVFSGGEPLCNVWVFAQHNYRWPEPYQHQLITNGNYSVQITINPQDGDSANWNFDFRIEGALEQQPPDQPSTLTAYIVQTGPNSDADVVSDALIFQVFASTDGVNDGAGIDRVDMRIIGLNGEVYQRTEQNAAYCAFSGGEPNCNVWNFAENGYQWPNGDPIEFGDEYLLQAIVHAEDGSSTTVEMNIQIQ